MSDRIARAQAIADAWNSWGGQIIRAEIDEKIAENRAYLDDLMQSKPEVLTGRMAIARSNRMKALTDLKEWVADEIRPLTDK